MAGTAFASIQDAKRNLIRKTLQGLVAVAPVTADVITDVTFADATGLLALPTGYEQLGVVDDNGAQFARSVTTAVVTSWGDQEPSREDVTADTETVQVVCNETRAVTLGLYTGADMSAVLADATTGVVMIDKPSTPKLPLRRVLVVGSDTTDDGEIYIGRLLPYAKITAYGNMQLNSSAAAASPAFDLTFTGFKDPVLGTAVRWLFGGPGWIALLSDMGISQAT